MRIALLLVFAITTVLQSESQVLNLVFTSDLHYGITRPHFRSEDSVSSLVVNGAQVRAINQLPSIGVHHVEGIIITGDITNREEAGVQAASVSWMQFLHDYRDGITLTSNTGHAPLLLVTPGNHDASNAAGDPRIRFRDAGAMAGMIQLERHVTVDTSEYDYRLQKLNYSLNLGKIHLVFINIWLDSANREWAEKDLDSLGNNTPTLLFMHDQPQGDPKHFTNPNPDLSGKPGDQYEHLLTEVKKDSLTTSTDKEQKSMVEFLQKHPNIKGWFHGHENFCQMYDYTALSKEIKLPVFRSDSPMKGQESKPDESKLSFQVISIDSKTNTLTATECFWNKNKREGKLYWGKSRTIRL